MFPHLGPDSTLLGRRQRVSNHHQSQSVLSARLFDGPRISGFKNLEPGIQQYVSTHVRKMRVVRDDQDFVSLRHSFLDAMNIDKSVRHCFARNDLKEINCD